MVSKLEVNLKIQIFYKFFYSDVGQKIIMTKLVQFLIYDSFSRLLEGGGSFNVRLLPLQY